jgi:hypothetical protein
MIEIPGLVLLARDEPETEDTRLAIELSRPLIERAQWLWGYRWEDRPTDWTAWNAVALRGPFGHWTTIDFQTWSGFGDEPAPRLTRLLRCRPALDTIDPLDVDLFNPPILIGAHRLMTRPPIERGRRFDGRIDRAFRFYRSLEQHGLLHDPSIHTKRGLKEALAVRGLQITPQWSIDLIRYSDRDVPALSSTVDL